MNKAVITANEFIVRVKHSDEGVIYTLRNPHTELDQDGRYDHAAYYILKRAIAVLKGMGDTDKDTTDNYEFTEE